MTHLLGDVGSGRLSVYDLLHRQMAVEFAASMDYLRIAAVFSQGVLPGFASWFRKQSDEERDHALRIYDFLVDSGQTIAFDFNVKKRHFDTNPYHTLAKVALDIEKDNTGCVDFIINRARSADNEQVVLLMQWFVAEQMEEEKWAEELFYQVKRSNEDFAVLSLFSEQWGKRASL